MLDSHTREKNSFNLLLYFACLRYQGEEGQRSCEDCLVGTSQSISGSASCDDCAPGFYSNAAAQENCAACDAGQTSIPKASSCDTCGVGKYAGSGQPSCQDCLAGEYSSSESDSCNTCAKGLWSSAGQESCLACAEGYNRDPNISGDNLRQCHCEPYVTSCSKGFYKMAFSSVPTMMCCPCATQTFQPDDDSQATSCNECKHPKKPNTDHDSCDSIPTFQSCDESTHVPVKILLHDLNGDGWDGTLLKVKKEAEAKVEVTLNNNFAWGYETACLPQLDDNCFTIEWSGEEGSSASDIRWEILKADNTCNYPTRLFGGSTTDLDEIDDLRVCDVSSLIGESLSGTYSVAPIEWCDIGRCPAGKFRVTRATNDDYSLSDIVNSCAPCVAGEFSDSVGDSCSVCPQGKISASRGNIKCDDCEVGKFNNDEGSDRQQHLECASCGKGLFSGAGAHACSVCPINQINDDLIAAESCKECR